MRRDHRSQYSDPATLRCERALVTLIGDIGPWRERLVLVGGLAPRYIVGSLPPGAKPHVGTTDVDLVVQLAVDKDFETYARLATNLRRSGFRSTQPSYRWDRDVDHPYTGVPVRDRPGRSRDDPPHPTRHRLRIRRVQRARCTTLATTSNTKSRRNLDYGGLSRVSLRVAGILSYIVLKTLAFQDRHREKDTYDLVYTLVNYPDGGSSAAGRDAATSPVRQEPQVIEALRLLSQRFDNTGADGPRSYASFEADPDDTDGKARLRNEAVAAVTQFLAATYVN